MTTSQVFNCLDDQTFLRPFLHYINFSSQRIVKYLVKTVSSRVSQIIIPHVVTTVAVTWEAAPVNTPVNTMAPVAMISTVSAMSNKQYEKVLHPSFSS